MALEKSRSRSRSILKIPTAKIEQPQAQPRESFTVDLTGSRLRIADASKDSTSVRVHFDYSGQHTITWDAPLARNNTLSSATLPPGKCNLYFFPAITPAGSDDISKKLEAESEGLEVMTQLLLLLATAVEGGKMFDTPDFVGAFPIHALLVCNTTESLAVGMAVLRAKPTLLTQLHVAGGLGAYFNGESCLHIVTVNRREEELLCMLDLAEEKLEVETFKQLLNEQPVGAFFMDPPMNTYGGTILAYACCFGLTGAVRRMLSTTLVDLSSSCAPCKISGFLPIHATIANRNTEMYDFLVSQLPEKPEDHRTGLGRALALQDMSALAPLGLAAKLGFHDVFIHILQSQCQLQWRWGDVSSYHIDLTGVDSSGHGGGDVMELITKVSATKETTEMLLDTFIQGFINKLFRMKWSSYGWKLHWIKVVMDIGLITITIALAFGIKEQPYDWRRPTVLPSIVLALIVFNLCLNATSVVLFFKNELGDGSSATVGTALASTIKWFDLQKMQVELLGNGILVVACVIILSGGCDFNLPPPSPPVAPPSMPTASPPPTAGRLLRASGGAASSTDDDGDDYVPEFGSMLIPEFHNVLWPFLAFGLLFRCWSATRVGFIPFEKINVFVLSVGTIIFNDLFTFLWLFCAFIVSFYCALYILYPQAHGFERIGVVAQFDTWYGALITVAQLGFLGAEFDVDMSVLSTVSLTSWQKVDLVCFAALYIVFILLSIILLLNLLIAMLSFTFDSVRQDSTLQCRLSFARHVLWLEMFAEQLQMQTRVGEKQADGRYIYPFRTVEGGAAGGSDDPFRKDDTMSSEDLAQQIRVLSTLVENLAKARPDDKAEVTAMDVRLVQKAA